MIRVFFDNFEIPSLRSFRKAVEFFFNWEVIRLYKNANASSTCSESLYRM